jgi:hypothetical protein
VVGCMASGWRLPAGRREDGRIGSTKHGEFSIDKTKQYAGGRSQPTSSKTVVLALVWREGHACKRPLKADQKSNLDQ